MYFIKGILTTKGPQVRYLPDRVNGVYSNLGVRKFCQSKSKAIFLLTLSVITMLSCNMNDKKGVNKNDGNKDFKVSINEESLSELKQQRNCNGNISIDSGALNIRVPLSLLDSIYIGPGDFETYKYFYQCKSNKSISIEIWHDIFDDPWKGRTKLTMPPYNTASYPILGQAKSMLNSQSRFQLIDIDSIVDYRQIGFIDCKVKRTGHNLRKIYVLSPKMDKWIKIECQYDNSNLGLRFRDSLAQITESICW